MTLLQSKRRNLTKKKQFSLLCKVVSLLFVIIVISFFLYYINIMIKQNEISISTTTTTFSPLNFENHHGNITTKTKYQQEAVIKSSVLEPSSLRIVATPPPTTPPTMMKVAFAITITKDGKFQDGAAVLAYSIIESFKNDPIDISFVAFVHPNVTTSRPYLRQIGFSVIEAPTPINVSAIKGKFLREHINDKAGCCGAAELIKLYSYRLTDFDWVVHLDADVIITKSFMELFSQNKSLIYTTDPNMASYKDDDKMPVQGGFLIIKPSLDDYARLIEVLMIGDYRSGSAWGGSGIGWFWGGKTIQGVLAYYYNRLNPPERSLRVDRCIYNTMADTPPCMATKIGQVKSAHFTVCQKPWNCDRGFANSLCAELHQKWRSQCHETAAYYNLTSPDSCCSSKGRYIPLPLTNAKIPSDHRFSLNLYPQTRFHKIHPLPGAGFIDIDRKSRMRRK